MTRLDDRAYEEHMRRLSDEDRRRVRGASRTGIGPDDPRLAVLADETTRRDRRAAGRLSALMLAQAVIVVLYGGAGTGVLPLWAIAAYGLASAAYGLVNGLRWWRLRQVAEREIDPLMLAAMQREASRPVSRTEADGVDRPEDGDR